MAKRRSSHTVSVMAAPGSSPGVVPAIHVFLPVAAKKDMDARDKRGHDGEDGGNCFMGPVQSPITDRQVPKGSG